MSRRTPSRSNRKCDANRRPLHSHQTPLRRSPRFLSQKKDVEMIRDQPTSRKQQPKSPSSNASHLRSSAISPHSEGSQKNASWIPRRSPRLVSNTAEATKKSVVTQQVFPVANQSNPQRSTGPADASLGRRRSPRLASISPEITKKEEAGLDATMERGKVEERKRPIRSRVSMKVPEEVEVGIRGMDNERGNTDIESSKKDSPVISKKREGGEKKRRKMEKNCKEKIGIENTKIEECCGFQVWTKEQEVALERAYLAAKPSPHFWKKVAKLVRGKSAQECFDRVHGSFATPPQPQPRSRRNTKNLSPIGKFRFSNSKSTSQLVEPKVKRPSRSRNKSLVAQKTARHLLRKHCLIDQNQEADYFAVLETSLNALAMDFLEIKAPTSPDCLPTPPDFLHKCNERSTSVHQKMFSRFKTLTQANHPSPEVLKHIKNMALHEKYIDQLHSREARRTFAKSTSTVSARDSKNNGEMKADVLKASRTALISEAREVISQFQHLQANPQDNHDSSDDDDDGQDDDDDDE